MRHGIRGDGTRLEGRAPREHAAQSALHLPAGGRRIDGARGILINVTGSSSLRLAEVNEASTIIQMPPMKMPTSSLRGTRREDEGEVKITVIATGFRSDTR